jgi:hypothetical protein
MNNIENLAELRNLQARVNTLRRELECSPPGEVTYLAPLDVTSDDTVVVVADGFGGATTSVVVGNYPVDYNIKFEKSFASESEAESAAEELACHGANPRQVLAAPA